MVWTFAQRDARSGPGMAGMGLHGRPLGGQGSLRSSLRNIVPNNRIFHKWRVNDSDELCIAPKYLSEISKSITGNSANWWINRFTVLDISRQLRDRSLSFVDISEMFNFSSPAYFSRYVQRYLGESPSEYRG